MCVYICMQELDDEEYGRWKEERENAELSAEQRDEKIFQSNCHIEQKLLLLGEFLSSLSLSPFSTTFFFPFFLPLSFCFSLSF